MKIKGRYNEYSVFYAKAGWSYAVVNIYIERKWWIFTWKKFLGQWGDSKAYLSAERLKKDEIIKWFSSAVREYEDYLDSWGLNSK